MPAITATDINDLVASTLRELGRNKWQQIAQSIVNYEVMPKWLKKDRVIEEGSIGIQRNLMNRYSSAAHVGIMDEDSVNIIDLMDQLNVPWRQAQTGWAFGHQETLMNKGEALIFNVIKPRRQAAFIGLAEELETKAWSAPASSSDKTSPYGLPYWITKASGTPSHQGSYPTGWTDIAGISLTDSPTFKNWTGQYVTVSKSDLVKKLRTAKRKCGFMSPVDIQDYRNGKGDRYRLYVNESTVSSFEDIGEAQNENLGRDIASIDGVGMSFRGHPIVYVPKLDEDTTNPVYGIDHSTFIPYVLKGDFFRESEAIRAPKQHNWFQFFVDLSYNYVCVDRRRNWVLYV